MSAKVKRVGLNKRALRTTFRAIFSTGFQTNTAFIVPITDSKSLTYVDNTVVDSGADITKLYRRLAVQIDFGDGLGPDVTVEVSVDGTNFVTAPESIMSSALVTPSVLNNPADFKAIGFMEIPISGVRVRLSLASTGGNPLTTDMKITVLMDDVTRLGAFPLH